VHGSFWRRLAQCRRGTSDARGGSDARRLLSPQTARQRCSRMLQGDRKRAPVFAANVSGPRGVAITFSDLGQQRPRFFARYPKSSGSRQARDRRSSR